MNNEMKTRIYITDISPLESDELFGKLFGQVSEYRKKKIEALLSNHDRCLSLGAECLLMYACGDFGVDYVSEEISLNEYGKPYFSDQGVFFNLSHSGDRAVCIMSDAEVGCDIERIRNVDNNIAYRFFSENEQKYVCSFDSEDELKRAFFRVWTLKESILKCVGTGMHIPLRSFSVTDENGTVLNPQIIGDGSFILKEESNEAGYQFSWCTEINRASDSRADAEIRNISLTDI